MDFFHGQVLWGSKVNHSPKKVLIVIIRAPFFELLITLGKPPFLKSLRFISNTTLFQKLNYIPQTDFVLLYHYMDPVATDHLLLNDTDIYRQVT